MRYCDKRRIYTHWGQTPLLFRNFVPVLAILTLQTVLNDNIKTAEDVETYLGLNTLVVVPDFGSKRNPEDEEKTEHKHRKLKRSISGFELETWRYSFFVCCRMKNYSPATVTSRSSTAHGTTRLFICCVSFEKVRFFSTSS